MATGCNCPWCGRYNAEGTEICWSCKLPMRRDPEAIAARSRKLMREISIFLIGYGIILAILGILALTLMEPRANEDVPRNLLLGIPLIAIGAAESLFGIVLAVTSFDVFAILGSVLSAIPSLFGLLFLSLATLERAGTRGGTGPWLGFALLIAIPALLGYRTYRLYQNGRALE